MSSEEFGKAERQLKVNLKIVEAGVEQQIMIANQHLIWNIEKVKQAEIELERTLKEENEKMEPEAGV